MVHGILFFSFLPLPLFFSPSFNNNTHTDHMDCHHNALKNYSTMIEYNDFVACRGRFIGDSVPSQCKPCQHAILDVWGGAKKELDRLVRVTEPGGPLGLISSQGWYISSDVARMYPELASYRGLMNSNVTHKIFKRPVTFGEFCYAMIRRTGKRGTEWDDSFCRMFYAYHTFVKPDYCATNPFFYIEQDVYEYGLCTLYIITVDDLWEYSPYSASDLEIYALCPICPRVMQGIDPLYPGKVFFNLFVFGYTMKIFITVPLYTRYVLTFFNLN